MIADDVAAAYADRDAALERLGAVLAELKSEHRRRFTAETARDEYRAERDQLARLHEVATERTVGLAAVIEQAAVRLSSHRTSEFVELEGTEWRWQCECGESFGHLDEGQPVPSGMTAVAWRLTEHHARILASADTDAALRERDAEKINEGRAAVLAEVRWLMDARNEYSDERVQDHMRVVEHLLRVLTDVPYSAEGWLPSWRWDAWDEIREGAKTDG